MTAQQPVTKQVPSTATTPRQLAIDPAHSSAEFAVKHLMIATVKGTMKIAKGSIRYDPHDISRTTIEADLDPASILTGDDKRDAHLRSPDFLDAAAFPALRFVATEVQGTEDEFRVRGDLTIRGATHPITLEVEKDGEIVDPWGKKRGAVTATTTLDRTVWGLTWNSALETGGVLVGDKVKVTLHLSLVETP